MKFRDSIKVDELVHSFSVVLTGTMIIFSLFGFIGGVIVGIVFFK